MAQAQRHEVEAALRSIVEQFGTGVRAEPDRLRALLHDVLGGSARGARAEIDALVAVARAEQPGGPRDDWGFDGATVAPDVAGDAETRTWARRTWASVLAAPPVAPHPPPVPHDPAQPTDGGRSGEPSASPRDDRRGLRRSVLVGGGAAATLLAAAGLAVALTAGRDDGDQVVSVPERDQAQTQEAPVASPAASSARGATQGPAQTSATPSPVPTSCPSGATEAVLVEFDIRHGLQLSGTVDQPEQHDALLDALAPSELAVAVDDFVTVGPGPEPEAVATLSQLLPAMVQSLAEGTAVATDGGVCVTGSYIDDEARAQLTGAAEQVAAGGGHVTLLVEQHPLDHALHEPILQAAINQAVGNQRIPFVTGSAELLPEADPILDRVVHVLNERFPESRFPGQVVTVEGHTDDVGSRQSNIVLSLARAQSVRDALVARGVPAERLRAVGHGPDEPLTTNATEEGRQINRRVVFNVGEDHSGAVHEQPSDAGGGQSGHEGH